MQFDMVKVFSATKSRERDSLGDRVTEWLDDNPEMSAVGTVVTQSSDSAFHCLTITLFTKRNGNGRRRRRNGNG